MAEDNQLEARDGIPEAAGPWGNVLNVAGTMGDGGE